MEHDRFELHLQPIMNLTTNRVTSADVLLRLRDCTATHVLPSARRAMAEAYWLAGYANVQPEHAKLGLKPLPDDWSVSSDSIAARAAGYLGAVELVLLKSTLADGDQPDYVDGYFAVAARGIPRVRFVNLRDPQFAERRASTTWPS